MIIDASIGIKWIKENEEYRYQALLLLKRHLTQREKIIVPSIFYPEVANYLVTGSNSPLSTIKKHLEFLYGNNLGLYEPKSDAIFQTTTLAKKHNTTVYDMLYAVTAKKYKTILITADEKFIQKTKFPFVKHISKLPK